MLDSPKKGVKKVFKIFNAYIWKDISSPPLGVYILFSWFVDFP